MAMNDQYGVDMGDPDPNAPFVIILSLILLVAIFW